MPVILCVEDEAALREDLAAELRDAGYDVLEAANGAAALGILRQQRPDLILCDITMPQVNGFDLLEAVRDSQPSCAEAPFVFLTALADRDHVVEGKRRGCDDYLTKPIDYDLLLATVEARLREVARMRRASAADPPSVEPLLELLDALSVGIAILRRDASVQSCNATAKNILSHPSIATLSGGRLRPGFGELSDALRQLARGALGARSAPISWQRTREGGRVQIQLAPMGDDGAMLLLRDPDAALDLTADNVGAGFGLTPAETRVAVGMMQGKDLKAIADECDVAESTVRTQLKAVLAKTETHRQSELVSLLWRMLLPAAR